MFKHCFVLSQLVASVVKVSHVGRSAFLDFGAVNLRTSARLLKDDRERHIWTPLRTYVYLFHCIAKRTCIPKNWS